MANLDAILKITAKGDASGLAGLNAGIKGIQKAGEQANSALGGIGNILGSVTGGVLALGAGLSAAGVAAFAKSAIDAADNLRDMSQRTGVSVEMLSRFEKAAAMGGTSIEVVSKNMERLSKGLYSVNESGGKVGPALERLGLSATDSAGKLKNADQVLLEIADKFQKMPDGVEKTALAIQLFGKAGAEIIPMLNEGRQAIEGLGATMTTDFADKADAFNDSLAATQIVFGQIGMAIADQLLPYLSSAVDWISKVGIGFRDYIVANKEPIQQTIETIGRVGAALAPWALGLGLVVTGYKLLTEAVKAAAIAQAALTALTGPAGWVKLGAAAVATAGAVWAINEATKGAGDSTAAAALEAQKLAAEMSNAATAAGGVDPPIDNAKAKQEAFKAAVQQTNAEYQLMAATIDATSQAIQRQGQLRDAALSADIAVNNAAKSILEYKLSQARTDADKIPILLEIKKIEMENARLQKEALDAQIIQETEIINLKRQKAWEELRSAQRTLDTANAMGEQTARLQEQVRLMQVAANSADTEYRIQQQIAAEKARGNQATYNAQRQIIGLGINQIQNQAATARPTGRTFNGRPTYMENGREMGAFTTNGVVQYKPISFAGGGYTGNAPRSGGLDGRGGFMAMLHPRETIIDHTRAAAGGSGGGGVPNITIRTGEVLQMPDGSQWVSMGDLEQAMQATAAGVLGALRTPGARLALGGS
jgi:hypothetical protein